MAKDESKPVPKNRRHITAMFFIVVFIILVLSLDKGINFLITRYLPNYAGYTTYVSEGANVILAIFGSYLIYRLIISLIEMHIRQERDVATAEIAKLIIRISFYVIAITLVLVAFGPSLGISLSQSLAGGAIGGIVLGLAVQTIASSILSGVLVSSSKTVTPGDVLIMHAAMWGDLICRVINVNILFTEVITQNGNRVKVPNVVLSNSTTFTKLKVGNLYLYPLQVTINADIPLREFDKRARTLLEEEFSHLNQKPPQFYLSSKISGANVFTVLLVFNSFNEVTNLIDIANKTFDDVYWGIKQQGEKGTS